MRQKTCPTLLSYCEAKAPLFASFAFGAKPMTDKGIRIVPAVGKNW